MLKYMSRENGEGYSTQFLVMLNTWEGAVEFFRSPGKKFQDVDIARILVKKVGGERFLIPLCQHQRDEPEQPGCDFCCLEAPISQWGQPSPRLESLPRLP